MELELSDQLHGLPSPQVTSVAIAQLLRATKPDRMWIEPSGLGHPAALVDVLKGEHLASALDLQPIICLVRQQGALRRICHLKQCTRRICWSRLLGRSVSSCWGTYIWLAFYNMHNPLPFNLPFPKQHLILLLPCLLLRGVVAQVDCVQFRPARLPWGAQPAFWANELCRDQVSIADILVGSKADQGGREAVRTFLQWAGQLYPPKLKVRKLPACVPSQ